MRVTQRAVTRNYLNNLAMVGKNRNDSLDRMASGRKYKRLSDNVTDSARALTVRDQLRHTEQALDTIRDANGPMASAESNLMDINELMDTARERLVQMMGTDVNEVKPEIVGKEIKALKEQTLQFINAKFSNGYLFAGTDQSGPPFTLNDDNDLLFNGVLVQDIKKDDDGFFTDGTGNPPVRVPVPQNGDVYVDIGLGIKMTGDSVDPRTAFKTSFSGLEILGYGKDADGDPRNIFEMLDEIEKTLVPADGSKPDIGKMSERIGVMKGKLDKRAEEFLINVTELGTRQSFIETIEDRLTDDHFNLSEMQNSLETVKAEDETIMYGVHVAAYNQMLQMGAQILPPSLMDYLR